MEGNGIVPDVIDVTPPATARIAWSSGIEVDMGNELTPTQVQSAPSTFSWPTESNALYSLVMIDPDAPNRSDRSFGEVLHWLVINIPGCDVSKGQIHTEHIGSGPREGSGLHRYVFLVYKQPGHVTLSEPYRPRGLDRRLKWSARQFAADNALGEPVAANFYQAQYDDYVPKLFEELMSSAKPK